MNRLSRYLALAALGLALIPAAAQAQFFGGTRFGFGGFGGGYGFGGMPGFGAWPNGGWPNGGWPYGTGLNGGWPYGGFAFAPPFVGTTTLVTPITFTVSTPRSAYERDVPVDPRMRPAVWPAIPYRDAPGDVTGASATQDASQARIDVRVPVASAEVSFDGTPMRQSGLERQFVTPSLAPGTYSFEIRASWRDTAGKQVTRSKRIEVRPGGSQSVDFTAAP
jgi:uncharacterized protein (TIGR03000 family)